ncbi:MAG TPA: glycine--tRNA ligase subunit beta [Halanaerobiales bacterium]|nr:glycine--tRNA ligase subunit beta [Halanaerobiales bacterium]
MAKDFLLEIGTEEMPAQHIRSIRKNLKALFKNIFFENRLVYSRCQVFSTPRRLTVYIKELQEKQKDFNASIKGPAAKIGFDDKGKPTKAAQGFAKSQGIVVDELVEKEGYLYAEKVSQGKATGKLLVKLLPEIIKKMKFPVSMRWGDYNLRFIRPIRWLLALFGDEVIEFTITDVISNRTSRGHRFLVKEPVKINKTEDYFQKLNRAWVIVNQQKRKEIIKEQIKDLSFQENNRVLIEEELIDEVTELLEYPTVFYGVFDEKFLKLPREVLITSMAEHQRYFPVTNHQGELLPYFVGVRDGIEDGISEVIKGNELVLKARLTDARFFFEEDLKTGIEKRQEKLKDIVFQEKLGSVYEKTLRMINIARKFGGLIGLKGRELKILERAAELSKNDLVSEMVNEFDKLQGVMGREYALRNGESPEVSGAIYEQYLPRFAGDELPETIYGQILSLVDKMDNICTHFELGHIPSGSQDPFALRRQANGIIKIITENRLKLRVSEIITITLEELGVVNKKIYKKIKDFLLQRTNNILEEEIRYDILEAVMANEEEELNKVVDRARAVMELRNEDPELFLDLVRGLVRAGNLAGKTIEDPEIHDEYFKTSEEIALYNNYKELKDQINNDFKNGEYLEGLKKLVKLRGPIDNFLDNVVVMVEDDKIRNNRLALLNKLSLSLESVMDIRKIKLD